VKLRITIQLHQLLLSCAIRQRAAAAKNSSKSNTHTHTSEVCQSDPPMDCNPPRYETMHTAARVIVSQCCGLRIQNSNNFVTERKMSDVLQYNISGIIARCHFLSVKI